MEGYLVYSADRRRTAPIVRFSFQRTGRCYRAGSSDRNSNIEIMDDIIMPEADFIEAVKEVRAYSSPGKDGIPALLLRKTMFHLAKPS